MTAWARHGLIWLGFALLVVLATAPAWRFIAFGFNPTLEEALLFLCSGGAR